MVNKKWIESDYGAESELLQGSEAVQDLGLVVPDTKL